LNELSLIEQKEEKKEKHSLNAEVVTAKLYFRYNNDKKKERKEEQARLSKL